MSHRSQNPEGSSDQPSYLPPSYSPVADKTDEKGIPSAKLAHLRDAVLMSDDTDDVIQREQGVALDLCVDVLALSAHSQELH